MIGIDQLVACPLGEKTALGNSLSLQVRRPTVERRDGSDWLRDVFDRVCCELRPAWAYSCTSAEYWSKVMSETPRIEAIGRDFSRFLPGIFWLNYFGDRYRSLLGREQVQRAPGARPCKSCDDTIIEIADGPENWGGNNYLELERRTRIWLGEDAFFSKESEPSGYSAPDWG